MTILIEMTNAYFNYFNLMLNILYNHTKIRLIEYKRGRGVRN